MPDLLLPSLEIQNFRAFEHLRIERLGRVNLITGKNNVGKTSLLEALYLYVQNATPYIINELLQERDELEASTGGITGASRSRNASVNITSIRHLFYDRPSIYDIVKPIVIGALNFNAQVVIGLDWFQAIEQLGDDETLTRRLIPVPPEERTSNPEAQPYLMIKNAQSEARRIAIRGILSSANRYLKPEDSSILYVKASGLSRSKVAQLWDNINLTDSEQDVIEALRIVAPFIDRVGIVGEREATTSGAIPVFSMKQGQERLTLRSLGEGASRLFGMMLALVNAQSGTLLVDEIETGLHYSVILDMWKLVFYVARRLNVQVFATTHSWDCIEAFQQAADEDENEEAMLIRLENLDGDVTATLFDERKLSIAARELIEVR